MIPLAKIMVNDFDEPATADHFDRPITIGYDLDQHGPCTTTTTHHDD